MKLSQKEKILLYSGIGIAVVGGVYWYVKSNSASAASPTSSPACTGSGGGGVGGATQPNYTCELGAPIIAPVIAPAPSANNKKFALPPPKLKAAPKVSIVKVIGDVSSKILSFLSPTPTPAPSANNKKFALPPKIKL